MTGTEPPSGPTESPETPGRERTAPDRIDLDLPARESTGDDTVDAALDQVDAARGSGLEEHLRVAGAAQDALQQRLADTGE